MMRKEFPDMDEDALCRDLHAIVDRLTPATEEIADS